MKFLYNFLFLIILIIIPSLNCFAEFGNDASRGYGSTNEGTQSSQPSQTLNGSQGVSTSPDGSDSSKGLGGGPAGGCANGGVKLNTNVPGIGQCIAKDDSGESFPKLMSGLMKILITLILSIGLIMIVLGAVLITTSGASQNLNSKGKELIGRVILGIILLGLSGIILHTINPNFFK